MREGFTNANGRDKLQKHKHMFAKEVREVSVLDEKDAEVVEIFRRLLPKISARDKERLAAFGSGLCFALESDPQIIKSLAKGGNRE